MASSDVYVPPDSTKEEIDATILRVSSKQKEWAELPVFVKLSLLREVIENAKAELHEWPITAARGHGYNPEDPEQAHLVAEMYLKGPVMLASWLRSTERLYVSLDATGAPPAPTSSEKRPNGDYSVKVFPQNVLETALADGSQGFLYTDQPVKQFNPLTLPAGVVGVLGAGNFDAPTDILGALFLENKVVVFKPNPVNHHSAIHIQRIFKPLVDAGYLGFVFGAREAGSAVVDNARISELCLTGSCMTYDAIVWGPGVKKPKADEKSDVKPRVTKPFKAELGSVNPYIICPGKWSESELNAHAEQLASSKMFNNAHICASPQVLVTCKKWPQREQFLNRVQQLLARSPPTRPFYPMCDKSYAEQLEKLSQTLKKNPKELIVANPALFPNQQHPIFARDVPTDAFVVQKEAFCPVLAEVPLDTEPTAEAFLPAAVKYCNEKVWGSLTCTLIVDSRTEAQSKAVVQKAVDDLEFGAIGVNQVAMFVVLFGQLVWGAYPRHSRYDIQSGMGKMGNTLCLEGIKKAVLWAPFTFPSMNKVPVNRKGQLLKAQRTADFLLHWNFYRLSKLLVNVLTGF